MTGRPDWLSGAVIWGPLPQEADKSGGMQKEAWKFPWANVIFCLFVFGKGDKAHGTWFISKIIILTKMASSKVLCLSAVLFSNFISCHTTLMLLSQSSVNLCLSPCYCVSCYRYFYYHFFINCHQVRNM